MDVYVGLGSNIEPKKSFLIQGVKKLGQIAGIEVREWSSLYQTKAISRHLQEDYLNAAVKLWVRLTPDMLLSRLLEIEKECGRIRTNYHGPRTLDLDILLFGKELIQSPDLIIPHPRMNKRGFVLIPLAEIAPEVIHPQAGKSVNELKNRVDGEGVRLLPGGQSWAASI